MSQHKGLLTPEDRARIMELQDLLIDRFVEHREAVAKGQEERVKIVEAKIDSLLREKDEIEKWAAMGSAAPAEGLFHPIGDAQPDRNRHEPACGFQGVAGGRAPQFYCRRG